ncbi:hypothetical protein HN832_03330 [archaeon]|jgi:hypothetical protein|nr:hypothetical protein [archaeon]MBT4373571.1 hypothetical protein [archaeon]MBT4532019.1 hypothetical protein [archaeon]MBT7001686.1 hypothetical protein [archaeon]MBT7282422.1 hypothetical protein [archaeon]
MGQKADVFEWTPSRIEGNSYIYQEELERRGLCNSVRDKKGVGRYVAFCDYREHDGIITGKRLLRSCERKGCYHLRRYLEHGTGKERYFSTEGEQENVVPFPKKRKGRKGRKKKDKRGK